MNRYDALIAMVIAPTLNGFGLGGIVGLSVAGATGNLSGAWQLFGVVGAAGWFASAVLMDARVHMLHEAEMIDNVPEDTSPSVELATAPVGWQAVPRYETTATITHSVDPLRVWLSVGNRRVPLSITPRQGRALAEYISNGHETVTYKLADGVFTRAQIEALRRELLVKRLANSNSRGMVILTQSAREAISALPH